MLSAKDTIMQLGGIARGTRLRALGFTRQSLAAQVDRGSIERIRHGVFAAGTIQLAVRAAVAHGGALTCVSLLRSRGVWVLAPGTDAPHVWLGQKQHRL